MGPFSTYLAGDWIDCIGSNGMSTQKRTGGDETRKDEMRRDELRNGSLAHKTTRSSGFRQVVFFLKSRESGPRGS